jgi:hypothetical protein
MGAPEPTKAIWQTISTLQFIKELNACTEIHMVNRPESAR